MISRGGLTYAPPPLSPSSIFVDAAGMKSSFLSIISSSCWWETFYLPSSACKLRFQIATSSRRRGAWRSIPLDYDNAPCS